MTDFHTSLDRALDPHNDWGIEGDALADLMAARDLMAVHPHHPVIEWRDPEPFTLQDITIYLEEIQVDIRAFALLCGDEPVAYDGFGAPLYAHQISPEGTE